MNLMQSITCLLWLAAGPAAAKPLTVVATIPDLASLAAAIGGDRVAVVAVAKGGQDPHFVDPKPSLILKLSRADVLILVGRELEAPWLPLLLRSARNRKILPGTPGYVDASEGIRILEEHTHGEKLSRAHGDVHPHGNPHWYLDPANHLLAAGTIRKALARLDPAGADGYGERHAALASRLEAGLAEWAKRMAPWRGVEVVTYHRSWIYFADRYGLHMDVEIEPRPGIPPAPGHTREVIEAIRARKVPLIIQDPYYDPAAGTEIARRTGASFLVLPSMVGGTDEVKDVFDLFDTVTRRFADSLAVRGDVPRRPAAHDDAHQHGHDDDHHHHEGGNSQ